VTGNERDDGLARRPTPIVYWPLLNERYEWRTMAYAVRSRRVGTPGFVRDLEQAVWSVNPDLPLARVQTVKQIQARSMAQTSFAMVMLGIAASVALLIGVVGIYGVIAYAVAQRSREIGIRMALGARMTDVQRVFMRQALRLTTAGILIGIGMAPTVTRVMATFLFGVGPTDPVTYAAVSGVLAVATLVGTYLPARRATRVDPLVALRAE
jgi:ABC-type antimicrobial peptide transport system permease subunit